MALKKSELYTSPLSIFCESGRSGLLFDKMTLSEYLNTKGYAIIWSLFGEKRFIARSNRFPGMLEINGMYWLNDQSDLEGSFFTAYTQFHTK